MKQELTMNRIYKCLLLLGALATIGLVIAVYEKGNESDTAMDVRTELEPNCPEIGAEVAANLEDGQPERRAARSVATTPRSLRIQSQSGKPLSATVHWFDPASGERGEAVTNSAGIVYLSPQGALLTRVSCPSYADVFDWSRDPNRRIELKPSGEIAVHLQHDVEEVVDFRLVPDRLLKEGSTSTLELEPLRSLEKLGVDLLPLVTGEQDRVPRGALEEFENLEWPIHAWILEGATRSAHRSAVSWVELPVDSEYRVLIQNATEIEFLGEHASSPIRALPMLGFEHEPHLDTPKISDRVTVQPDRMSILDAGLVERGGLKGTITSTYSSSGDSLVLLTRDRAWIHPSTGEYARLRTDAGLVYTDSRGAFEFENLPAGPYRLICVAGQGTEDIEVFHRRLEVEPNSTLDLGMLYSSNSGLTLATPSRLSHAPDRRGRLLQITEKGGMRTLEGFDAIVSVPRSQFVRVYGIPEGEFEIRPVQTGGGSSRTSTPPLRVRADSRFNLVELDG